MPTETYSTPGMYTFDASDVQEVNATVEGAGGGGGGGAGSDVGNGGNGGPGGLFEGTIDTSSINTLTIQVGGGGGGGGAAGGGGGAGGSPGGGDGGAATDSFSGGGGGGGGATIVEDGSGSPLVIADAGAGGNGRQGGFFQEPGGGGGGERGGSGASASGGNGSDGAGTGTGGNASGGSGGAEIIGSASGSTTAGGGASGGSGGNSDFDFFTGGAAGGDGNVVIDYVEAPTAPTGLSATPQTNGVLLEWVANDPDATTRLFRSTSPGVGTADTLAGEAEPGVESLVDTAAEEGVQYYYVAQAYDASTDTYSSASNEVSALIPLPAPTNLTVASVGSGTADLSWADNSTDETGYRVEIDPDDDGTWEVAANLSAGTESHTLTGLLNGQLYGARIVAVAPDDEAIDQ